MKNLIFPLFCLILFFSCSENEDQPQTKWDNDKYPQFWKLVSSSSVSTFDASPQKDIDLGSDYYYFKSDSSFSKHSKVDNVDIEAKGTFSKKTGVDGKYLTLKFLSGYQTIGSCYRDSTESLWLPSDRLNLFNTWENCDGPRLEYRRVE